MSLQFHMALVPLLITMQSVTAQTTAPESDSNNLIDHRRDAPDSDAVEGRLLRALDAAAGATTDPTAVYRIYQGLANLNEARHQYNKAESYYQSTYNVAKSLFGDRSGEVVKAVNSLGEMRLEQGRPWEADRAFHQALKILESDENASRIDTAAVLNNLAAVQHVTGNVSRAVVLMRKVVGIFETDPAVNEEGFGTALSNLAAMLRELGNRPEAITAAQRAVSILERCKNSDAFAVTLVMLSRLHLDDGDSAAAEASLRRALRTIDGLGQEDSPTRGLIFGHLGVIYGRTGRPREAEPLFQSAIEMNRRFLGPEHPMLLDSMGAYANFLRTTKRKGEAKKLDAYIREHREYCRQKNPSVEGVVDVHTLMKQNSH
jgi:tetratricopeptide (TPR) repeat protein